MSPLVGRWKLDDTKQNGFIEQNRLAWEKAAAYHKSAEWDSLLQHFSDPTYVAFADWMQDILVPLTIKGKKIVQPCCNNGREIISLQRMGAQASLGLDFSDEFIKMGRNLATHAQAKVEFAACNVLDIPNQYHKNFDVVFISVGTLGWFNDLEAFFAACSKLLVPTGQFWILEMHPILDMFEPGGSPTVTVSSYFRTEPFVENEGLDYIAGIKYESPPTYWFPHRISDILGGLMKQRFDIKQFDELPYEISLSFSQFKNFAGPIPPLSYFLRAARG